jgi:hypothetical protein
MGICIQQIRCGVKPPLLTTHAAREMPAMSISLRFQRDVPERFPLFPISLPRSGCPDTPVPCLFHLFTQALIHSNTFFSALVL